MSKKNVKAFLKELAANPVMHEQLRELKPASPKDVVSFAKNMGLSFTKDEMKSVLVEMGALILPDEALEQVSAGAYPTAVNRQITDSITQANTKVLGEAPAMAMGSLYQTIANAVQMAAQNATTCQQQANVTIQTATTMAVSHLIGH